MNERFFDYDSDIFYVNIINYKLSKNIGIKKYILFYEFNY